MSRVYSFSTSDFIFLSLLCALVVALSWRGRAGQGFVLSSLLAVSYLVFLRTGHIYFSGAEIVACGLALAIGVMIGLPRRHLIFPSALSMVLIGFVVAILGNATSRRMLVLALGCLLLSALGAISRWSYDRFVQTQIVVFRAAQQNIQPLLIFLALYIGSIFVFAFLYLAINNTFGMSFVLDGRDGSAHQPRLVELITLSGALMINSSYANYSNIRPANDWCRALALFESFTGIVFFVIYLQLLLTRDKKKWN